jgi:quercetin dioxygenase-like cupin family protein
MGTYFLLPKLTCKQQAYYSLAANCAVNAVAAKGVMLGHPSPRTRLHKFTANNSKGTTMNQPSSTTQERAQLSLVSNDSSSIAGEPLAYPSTPDPEISSYILPIAPGAVTEWMVHPVPGYLYVLEGTLTVEFADDGSRQSFEAGQAFLQARAKWHRGRNDGNTPVRFLAVFCGAKDVPTVLHPPQATDG